MFSVVTASSSLSAFPGDRAGKVAQLRAILAEKFPMVQPRANGVLATGVPEIDEVEGGLRRAALTEFSASSGAGALFIRALLRTICRERCLAALVDAGRSFDAEGAGAAGLARLLVVFSADGMQAVKATDLLLRDGNLSLVLLDMQAMPPRELQRIPANTWHRLQRLAEQTSAALVALTSQPMIEAAQVRIGTGKSWTLDTQRRWQRDVVASTAWRVFPRRVGGRRMPVWEDGHASAIA